MDVEGKPPCASQLDASVKDVTVAAFDHAGAQGGWVIELVETVLEGAQGAASRGEFIGEAGRLQTMPEGVEHLAGISVFEVIAMGLHRFPLTGSDGSQVVADVKQVQQVACIQSEAAQALVGDPCRAVADTMHPAVESATGRPRGVFPQVPGRLDPVHRGRMAGSGRVLAPGGHQTQFPPVGPAILAPVRPGRRAGQLSPHLADHRPAGIRLLPGRMCPYAEPVTESP